MLSCLRFQVDVRNPVDHKIAISDPLSAKPDEIISGGWAEGLGLTALERWHLPKPKSALSAEVCAFFVQSVNRFAYGPDMGKEGIPFRFKKMVISYFLVMEFLYFKLFS